MQLIMRAAFALILTVAVSATALAQVQAVQTVQTVQTVPNRIPQLIIVNGQQVNGAYVPSASGGMQSFTCPAPQEYVTSDGASRGWACFDASTGVWLLNALPPAPQPVQQPTVIYQTPAPTATVVYQPATVVYAEPAPVVVVRPAYSPRVVIGAAVINATGRIVSAAIRSSYPTRVYYDYRGYRDYRDYRDYRNYRYPDYRDYRGRRR
jgi:hypothetical protein